MNLTHNLKIFPKLVTWPLTYDLFLKVMFVGNGVPWYRYRARVLLPSVWGLGTCAKVSLCDIDDFHIVRDLDWPCQRSTEVNDLLLYYTLSDRSTVAGLFYDHRHYSITHAHIIKTHMTHKIHQWEHQYIIISISTSVYQYITDHTRSESRIMTLNCGNLRLEWPLDIYVLVYRYRYISI